MANLDCDGSREMLVKRLKVDGSSEMLAKRWKEYIIANASKIIGVYGGGDNEDVNGTYKRDGIHVGSHTSNNRDNPLLSCLNLFKLLLLLYLVFIFHV